MNNTADTGLNSAWSGQDVEHWHSDDLHAGRLVAGLITGLFVVGLLMYSIIWLTI